MDSMLGHIKDIVQPKDATLYAHIHKHVVKSVKFLRCMQYFQYSLTNEA